MKIYSSRTSNSDIPRLAKLIGKDAWVLCQINSLRGEGGGELLAWVKVEESTPYDFICAYISFYFLRNMKLTEEEFNDEAYPVERISKTAIKIVNPMEIYTTEELLEKCW